MIPKVTVAIGASCCMGEGDPEGGGYVGRLNRWLASLNQRKYIYNLGISGDTSSGVRKRLAIEISPRKPQLALVQIGINDIWREGGKDVPPQIPLSVFADNIKNIISIAQATAGIIFISILPFDERKTAPVSWVDRYFLLDDAKQYAQTTKEICQETDTPYLDIFNQWLKEDYTQKYLAPDGLHANTAGHQYVFGAIRDYLLERYSSNEN